MVICGVNVMLSHTYTDRTTQITAKKCNIFQQRGHVRPAIKAPIGAAKLLVNIIANASSGWIIIVFHVGNIVSQHYSVLRQNVSHIVE